MPLLHGRSRHSEKFLGRHPAAAAHLDGAMRSASSAPSKPTEGACLDDGNRSAVGCAVWNLTAATPIRKAFGASRLLSPNGRRFTWKRDTIWRMSVEIAPSGLTALRTCIFTSQPLGRLPLTNSMEHTTMKIALRRSDVNPSAKKVEPPKFRSNGITFVNPQDGDICYIGPCDRDDQGNITGTRTVCYFTDSGCDDCVSEQDPACV